MRRVVYSVAASLDGFIAGPKGEIDWIISDPNVDFAAIYSRFDTVLLGRRTYEMTQQPGAPPWPPGWRVVVFSRTLGARESGTAVVDSDVRATVSTLRAESGRDIWLFGGAKLFASLLALQLVDEVNVAVMPVLLGGGVPLVDGAADRSNLTLAGFEASPSGIVNLRYEVRRTER